MELKPGQQLQSTCCETRVVVVRPPSRPVYITCGGHPMAPAEHPGPPPTEVAEGHDAGSQLGKRYRHEGSGLELLCTQPGAGSLAVDGGLLETREARAVPSSD